MSKVTILNASPRKSGLVSRMLAIMADELRACHHEVHLVNVNQLSVRPCIGCMKCRSSHACVLPEDDSQRILALLQGSDAVVVGTPCYWGNMTGQLKLLFDRMVYGMMGESPAGLPLPLHKGKRAVIVSTCTTPWPFNLLFRQSDGAVRAVKEVLKWSGFTICATIQKGGTRKHPELTVREEGKCRRASRRLCPATRPLPSS